MQINIKKLINRTIETLDEEREGLKIEIKDFMVEEIIVIYTNYIKNEGIKTK